MLSSINFWMCLAGMAYLAVGLFVVRREFISAHGWKKLITLGCTFFAAPLAAFSMEHFFNARFIKEGVPSWMPGHLFWTYFVGVALLAAATSLALKMFVRWSSALLGVMFLLFVLMLHIPNVVADPKNRISWAVALRDLSFSGGAWALAGLYSRTSSPQTSRWMILAGRVFVAVAVIFFAVEHFLHPEFAPGVPLAKITPSWFPLPRVWGYLAGAILLIAGPLLLANKKSRIAAASVGMIMTALTAFLYLPILIQVHAGSTPQITEAINYVADTLLFAGTALVLASALPRGGRAIP